MRVYVSVDIEGVAGVAHWDEALGPEDAQFKALMTQETIAACRAAIDAGADEVVVKDAHYTGRNLLLEGFPERVSIIRGWSGSPMFMLQELDQSFDAVVMIGWHARAGAVNNPLAHSYVRRVSEIRLNGAPMSEFGIYARLANSVGVPVVFVSGDGDVCADAKTFNSSIETAAVSRGVGDSSICVAPAKSRVLIYEGVKKALSGNLAACRTKVAGPFEIDVAFSTPVDAYKSSWYPGAKDIGDRTVRFVADEFFDIARFLLFVLL